MSRGRATIHSRRSAACAGLSFLLVLLASHLPAQTPAPSETLPAPQPAEPAGTPVVSSYPVPPERAELIAAELRRRFPAATGARIAADRRGGQLLVIAPPEVQRQIQLALAEPDAVAPRPDEPSAKLSHTLEHVSGMELIQALGKLGGGRLLRREPAPTAAGEFVYRLGPEAGPAVQLLVDAAAKQITLTGPQGAAQSWQRVVRGLDQPAVRGPVETQLVSLHNADRDNVRFALSALTASLTQAQPNEVAQAVRAPRPPRWAGDLVNLIFQDPAPAQPPAVQPPPVEAGPGNAAPPAGDVPPGGEAIPGAPAGGPLGNVEIQYLEGLDILVVRGNKRDVERVIAIINQIEQLSAGTQPRIEVLPLKHVDSEALAALVLQIYNQVLAARGGSVSITPLVKPNALLIIGRPESTAAVIELVQRLDEPVPPATQFQVFLLKHMPSAEATTMITNFFANRAGLGPRVRTLADFRTNAVIVQASPRDLEEVRRFLESIDKPTGAATSELRVFPLRNALATELAPILQDAITVTQTGGGQQQIPLQPGGAVPGQPQPGGIGGQQNRANLVRSAVLTFATVDPRGRQLLKSGILTDVRITADGRANAIVVTAPPESMDLIGALISQLDLPPAAEAQIKVFTIVNGDATNLATMLQTLFGQATGQGGGGNAQALLQQAIQGAGNDTSLVRLRFTVDQRTNSIIASGSAGDLAVVEAILLRLDESDVRNRQNTVYRLKSAPAIDVSNALNEFLRSQRDLNTIAPQSVSPFEQIEREVIIVPEPVSNSLVISATPRYFSEVMKIVEQLDARPPMVLIQVLIAEITLSNFEEFGIEIGLQDSILFDRSVVAGGVQAPGFNFPGQAPGNSSSAASLATRNAVGTQAIGNFSLGRQNGQLGYGGLVLSASSDAVNILIRALQERRRLQVLSRPQVMTLDNQPCFVQVGARVPRITSSQLTQTGTINNTVLENVGILLGVTPRISPDGLVLMEIDAEKSELGPIETGIPISINENGDVIRSPQIFTTTAQTTVSSRSGQTVILGGLITRSRSKTERRVPWLSDLPVVGNAFRFDSTSDQRTELLIIMTPYVVRTQEDMEWLKQVESERMHWCLADVVDVHGPAGLRSACDKFDPTDPRVCFPDQNPNAAGGVIPHRQGFILGRNRLPKPAMDSGPPGEYLLPMPPGMAPGAIGPYVVPEGAQGPLELPPGSLPSPYIQPARPPILPESVPAPDGSPTSARDRNAYRESPSTFQPAGYQGVAPSTTLVPSGPPIVDPRDPRAQLRRLPQVDESP